MCFFFYYFNGFFFVNVEGVVKTVCFLNILNLSVSISSSSFIQKYCLFASETRLSQFSISVVVGWFIT